MRDEGDVICAVGHHLQVHGHVAGMSTLGILGSMLFAIGIEVAARGLEIRPIALGGLMDVDRVLALGKIRQIQLDPYPIARGSKRRRPCILTLNWS